MTIEIESSVVAGWLSSRDVMLLYILQVDIRNEQAVRFGLEICRLVLADLMHTVRFVIYLAYAMGVALLSPRAMRP